MQPAGHRQVHLHFHGVGAEDVAAIRADVNEDDDQRVASSAWHA
jgi:hypothetical protein